VLNTPAPLRPQKHTNSAPVTAAAAAARRIATSPRVGLAYGEQAASAARASSRTLSPAATAALAMAAGGAAAAVASTSSPAQASSSAPPPAPAAADPYAPPPGAGARGRPTAVTLYQYEVCPFCCKVKAFLDFHRVPYTVVEVNPLTKAELKALAADTASAADANAPPLPPLKKVPVVRLAYADGKAEEVVADSSVIISRLAAELGIIKGGGKGKAPPADDEETRWRRWADERLVKTITANIYRSWDESWQTFSYITREAGDAWGWAAREGARVAGAVLMWRVGQGMPRKYGIEGDLREALYADLDAFADAVEGGGGGGGGGWLQKNKGGGGGGGGGGGAAARPFLGGVEPNLGDLAVYGVIRAIRGTNTYNDMVERSRIRPWLARMDAAVGDGARVEQGAAGAARAA
jgi:microsomal prostaglandin-E synthase 2